MRIIVLVSFLAISIGLFSKSITPGYTFKQGQILEYKLEQHQQMRLTLERYTGEIEQTNTYKMYFEVKEASKREVNFIFKLNDIKLKVNRNKSGILDDIALPAFNMDSLLNKYVLNRTFFIRMDVYGNIVSITPPEFTFKPYDMDTLQYDALMEFANRENIRSLVNHIFMVYPRNPITIGDEWNNYSYLDAGIPVKSSCVLKIQEHTRTKNMYRFTGQFSVSDHPFLVDKKGQKPAQIKGPLRGKITTMRKNGWVVKKEWSGNFTGDVWVDNHKAFIKNELTFIAEKLN